MTVAPSDYGWLEGQMLHASMAPSLIGLRTASSYGYAGRKRFKNKSYSKVARLKDEEHRALWDLQLTQWSKFNDMEVEHNVKWQGPLSEIDTLVLRNNLRLANGIDGTSVLFDYEYRKLSDSAQIPSPDDTSSQSVLAGESTVEMDVEDI